MKKINELIFWTSGDEKKAILDYINSYQGIFINICISDDKVTGEMDFGEFTRFVDVNDTNTIFFQPFTLDKDAVCISEEFLSSQATKAELASLFEKYGISIDSFAKKVVTTPNLFYKLDKEHYTKKETILLDKIDEYNLKYDKFDCDDLINSIALYIVYNGCVFRTRIDDHSIIENYYQKRISFLKSFLSDDSYNNPQILEEEEFLYEDAIESLKYYLLKDDKFWTNTNQKERKKYIDKKINNVYISPEYDRDFYDIMFRCLQDKMNVAIKMATGRLMNVCWELYYIVEQLIKDEYGDFRKMKKCREEYIEETVECWNDTDKEKYESTVLCDICKHQNECSFYKMG